MTAASPGEALQADIVEQTDSFDWTTAFTAVSRVTDLWMPSLGNGDSMSVVFNASAEQNEHIYGANGLNETWYVSRDSVAGTQPLYRLWSSSVVDHIDSLSTVDGSGLGYVWDGGVYYPWTSQIVGTLPITRYLKSSIFDHRTWLSNSTPTGYALDTIFSAANGQPRYGYQRFGNLLTDPGGAASVPRITFGNSTVSVGLNQVWGNAIESIKYLPFPRGSQELVRDGIGELVQSVIYFGTCCAYNPTQAGAVDCSNGCVNQSKTERWAGSPVLSNTWIDGTTQQTLVKPFNYPSGVFSGTDGYGPLLWQGTFRKTTAVGYKINGTLYPEIMHMSFEAKLDSSNVAGNNMNMTDVFWLNLSPYESQPGNSNITLQVMDVTTGTLQSLALPPDFNSISSVCYAGCTLSGLDLSGLALPAKHAIIASKRDATFAVGIYSPALDLAEYQVMFWCDGTPPVNGQCPAAYQALVINAFDVKNLTTAWSPNEDAFMVVGPLSTVITRLQQIYRGY